jgi:hypothetical protein
MELSADLCIRRLPPSGGVTIRAPLDFFGVCSMGGLDGDGYVFELTYSNQMWALQHIYDFTGGADGGDPAGSVVLDNNGNLYGTAFRGGNMLGCQNAGCGTVWEITGLPRSADADSGPPPARCPSL